MIGSLKSPALWVFVVCLGLAYYVGKYTPPTWTVNKITLDVHLNEQGEPYFTKGEGKREKKILIKNLVPFEDSQLHPEIIARLNQEKKSPSVTTEFVYEKVDGDTSYYQVNGVSHWQYWSLLPAVVAILLCWVTREPVTSLAGGVIAGAFLLGKYDITEAVLVQNLMTKSAAGITILYLWFLGGLMGIWARTGASQAFAELMTKHVVRGPKTAKLVAWMLGIIFFSRRHS
jgi:hypothetical protein